jgi:IS1 family transposase
LAPLGLHHGSTAGAAVYRRHLEPGQHIVGTPQTQKIDRTHLPVRTRLKHCVPKTIGFSPSMRRHHSVIG